MTMRLRCTVAELDTQREDWLLRTECLHGARPRRITRERPPLIERQILMEEEVITPPRGGRPAPVNQVPPGGVRVVPQIFTGVRPREGGPDRHKDVESPVDRLVDTVARMQMDLVFDAIVSSNGWDNVVLSFGG